MDKKYKILKGKVISDIMDKTIKVLRTYFIKHNLYKKYIKKNQVFFVHDENNICKKNDIVFFHISRPISKKKRWILLKKYDTN